MIPVMYFQRKPLSKTNMRYSLNVFRHKINLSIQHSLSSSKTQRDTHKNGENERKCDRQSEGACSPAHTQKKSNFLTKYFP